MFFCFQHKLVTPYSIKYAGVEWPEKAENLRNKLKKDNITAMVISEMVSRDVKLDLAEHSSLCTCDRIPYAHLHSPLWKTNHTFGNMGC